MKRTVTSMGIALLLIITGFSQAPQFYSVEVTKNVGFCPEPKISENCTFAKNTTVFWVPYASYVYVEVNVTNTGKLPVSGFLWDIYPKNTYLLESTLNIRPSEKINTTYLTVTNYIDLRKITGVYYDYFPGVERLITLANASEEDYGYILAGFSPTGNYKFIILQPNESVVLSYFIYLNQTGVYDLGRAIFTTEARGFQIYPDFEGHFCEKMGGYVEQVITLEPLAAELHNVSIHPTPVYDFYGNETSHISVTIYPNFFPVLSNTQTARVEISVDPETPIGTYSFALYGTSDEIPYTTPVAFSIKIEELQSDDPNDYCYVPIEYEIPFLKIVPEELKLNLLPNTTAKGVLFVENGAPTQSSIEYSITCGNFSKTQVISLLPGKITPIYLSFTEPCEGNAEFILKDAFNNTVQKEIIPITVTAKTQLNESKLEIINCTTYNPVPSEIKTTITKPEDTITLCVENTGDSTITDMFVSSSRTIKSIRYLLNNESTTPPYLPPSEVMKIILTIDTKDVSSGEKIPITVYGDGNTAQIVLNVSSIEKPSLSISPQSITIGCNGSYITVTNTGNASAPIDYWLEGDLAKYLIVSVENVDLTNFNLAPAINISTEDWVGGKIGKNIINFKDNESTEATPSPFTLAPGATISLKIIPNYLRYWLDNASVTTGRLVISTGNETYTIDISLETSQLNCNSNESTVIYYTIPSRTAYKNQGLLSVTTYHPPEFPFKDMVKVFLFNYYKGDLTNLPMYINGNYKGESHIGTEQNIFAICVTELGILDCYRKLQLNKNASLIVGHAKNTTMKIEPQGTLSVTIIGSNITATVHTTSGVQTYTGTQLYISTSYDSTLLFNITDFYITTENPKVVCENTTLNTTYGTDKVYKCNVSGNTTVFFTSHKGKLYLHEAEIQVGGIDLTDVTLIEITGAYSLIINGSGLLEISQPGEVYYIDQSSGTNQTLSNVIIQVSISGTMKGNITGENMDISPSGCSGDQCDTITIDTEESSGNITFIENTTWDYIFKIDEKVHCPLYTIDPEVGELYVPPGRTESQEFTLTNIGDYTLKKLEFELTGETELLTYSGISPKTIYNLNPYQDTTITWSARVPNEVQPNTTYRGAMVIKDSYCGVKYIPLTLHVVNYTLTVVPYDVETGENLTGMEVYVFSKRTFLKEVFKGHYRTSEIFPGTHTLIIFDPTYTYLPVVLPFGILKNEFNKTMRVPMSKGEILNLSVDVDCNETLAQQYNDPYGCYVNGGAYMNISIVTNIKDLKFMIPMNFTVEFSAVNVSKEGNVTGGTPDVWDGDTLTITDNICLNCSIKGMINCINGTCSANHTEDAFCSFYGDFNGTVLLKNNKIVNVSDLFCVGEFWDPESSCTFDTDACDENCSCSGNGNCTLKGSKISMVCKQKMIYYYKMSYRCDPPETEYGFCYIPYYHKPEYPPMYWLYFLPSLGGYVFGVGYPPAYVEYEYNGNREEESLIYIPDSLLDLIMSSPPYVMFYDVFNKTIYDISITELRNFKEEGIQVIETANFTVLFSSYYLKNGETFYVKATVKHPGDYPYPAYNISLSLSTPYGMYVSPVNETTGDFICENGFCTDTTTRVSWPYIDVNDYRTYTWKLKPGYNLLSGVHNITFTLNYSIFVGDQWRHITTSKTVPVHVVRPAMLVLEAETNVNYMTSDPRLWPGKRFPIIVVVYNQGDYPEYNVQVSPVYWYNVNFLTSCEFSVDTLRPGEWVSHTCYASLDHWGDGVVIFRAIGKETESYARVLVQGIDFTEISVGNWMGSYTLPDPFKVTIIPRKVVFPPMYPGDTQTASFSIVNHGVLTYILKFQKYVELNGTNETSPVDWISFSPQEIELAPGQTVDINITVTIPENLSPGKYVGNAKLYFVTKDNITVITSTLEIPVKEKLLLNSRKTVLLQTENFSTEDLPYFECEFISEQLYLSCKLHMNTSDNPNIPDATIDIPNVTTNITSINITSGILAEGGLKVVVDKDGNPIFVLSNGIYGKTSFLLTLGENETQEYTFELLASNPSVKLSPSVVTLHPGESAEITMEISMPPGMRSGIYTTQIFITVKQSPTKRQVISIFPIKVFVPDLIFFRFSDQPYHYCYFVPTNRLVCIKTYNITVDYNPWGVHRHYVLRKALGWHKLGACVPFNITIDNRYSVSIKGYAENTTSIKYFTNEFVVPAQGTYELKGCAVVDSQIIAWKTVRSGSFYVGNRKVTFWVNFYAHPDMRKAYFSNPCNNTTMCLVQIPENNTGTVKLCVSQKDIKGTTYAYLTYKPSNGVYDPDDGGFIGGGKSIPATWLDKTNITLTIPENGTSCTTLSIHIPEGTPAGNYYGAFFVKFVSPEEEWYPNVTIGRYPLALTVNVPSWVIVSGNILLRMADGEEYSLNNPNEYMLEPIVTIENYYANDEDDLTNVTAKIYGTGSQKIGENWISLLTPTIIPNATWKEGKVNASVGEIYISRIHIPENTPPGRYTGIVWVSWIRDGVFEERRVPITIEVYNSLYTITKRLIRYVDPNSTINVSLSLYNRNIVKNLTDVQVKELQWIRSPIANPDEYLHITWDGVPVTEHSGIEIPKNETEVINISISADWNAPAGLYIAKLVFMDSVGRIDTTVINIHVTEQVSFSMNETEFTLSEGMNTTAKITINVGSALPGVKCFDGSPGTYVFLSKHGPAAQFIELPEEYKGGRCLPIPDTYVTEIKIHVPEGTHPGIYEGKISLRTTSGRELKKYIKIYVPSTYYMTISPTRLAIPNNGSAQFTLTLHNARLDNLPVTVRFKFDDKYSSWFSIDNFTLTAPANGTASINITATPPVNLTVISSGYAITIDEIPVNGTKQHRTGVFKIYPLPDIRVRVIVCNSTENCTYVENFSKGVNMTAYDLLPAYLYIEITNYNVLKDDIRITTDAPMNIMSIVYGPRIEHQTMRNSITKGETQTYTLYLFYPNNYPPGNYTYNIEVDSFYTGVLAKFPVRIKMVPALEVEPRIYSEAIPGEPTQIEYTIRNNAGVDIQLTSSVFGTTSSPLNKSWFSGIDPVIPAKGNYTIIFNYTLPAENLGAYYGKILSVSEYGHLRYSDLIIKSQVDAIIGVC